MRLKFSNSSSFTTLDLYEYTLDSERILAAYACLNGNFKLYNVTCDPQNKIVSSKKFKALLDSKTNIGIIYDGYKKISVAKDHWMPKKTLYRWTAQLTGTGDIKLGEHTGCPRLLGLEQRKHLLTKS
ncbi:14966_t:CDS:2 [Gigaspora rosea]|nr:14966_t:CDS:2 [Gigaspora rosea]